ncbi:unnamed protein product [Prunus armeniaca]|uniref:Uncharacterized protein n=1 Tax=Prunus armeniaca TaxID=36596 RepID=A0A6J5VDP2_PRUAR|nr:unnamed protein product [Prunus armeniaca]
MEKGEEQLNPRLPRKKEELKNVEKNSTGLEPTKLVVSTISEPITTMNTQCKDWSDPKTFLSHSAPHLIPVTEGELMHNSALEKAPAHKSSRLIIDGRQLLKQ